MLPKKAFCFRRVGCSFCGTETLKLERQKIWGVGSSRRAVFHGILFIGTRPLEAENIITTVGRTPQQTTHYQSRSLWIEAYLSPLLPMRRNNLSRNENPTHVRNGPDRTINKYVRAWMKPRGRRTRASSRPSRPVAGATAISARRLRASVLFFLDHCRCYDPHEKVRRESASERPA